MEENRNDPLTFIGFLLISIIIMFWYYSNQSIPAIVENDAEIIENTISEDELLIDNKPKEIKKENKYDFEQKKIVLENDKIYLEIDTKGANITLLNLKEYTNYNDESLMLVDLDNSSLNISLPDSQNNRIIDSKDIIFDSDILEENKKIKLTGYISDDDGKYQYMVYVPELDITTYVTLLQELNNFTCHLFSLFVFMNQENDKKKIKLQLVYKD